METTANMKRIRVSMKDYGISEAPEGMLTWAWVSEQMEQSRNYWIGTTRPNGNPHTAPVWGVWLDGALYFGTNPESLKGRNIAANPNIVVHLESGDDVVILEGRVEITQDAALTKHVGAIYAKKYAMPTAEDELAAGAMMVLKPHTVMAWKEQDFPNTATKWITQTQAE